MPYMISLISEIMIKLIEIVRFIYNRPELKTFPAGF